jgi:hypothetical protein
VLIRKVNVFLHATFHTQTVGNHYQSHSKVMNNKEIIKYLEIVFNDITDFELVSVNNASQKF